MNFRYCMVLVGYCLLLQLQIWVIILGHRLCHIYVLPFYLCLKNLNVVHIICSIITVWKLHSPMDAEVYRARHQTTGEIVALKHILFSDRNVRPIHLKREIYALSILKPSENVIKLCGLYEQVSR